MSMLTCVEVVATFVDESIRQHEMSLELLKVQKRLYGYADTLVVPGRSLIKVGDVHKVGCVIHSILPGGCLILWQICRKNHQKRTLMLFSDLLIYAR